MAEPLDLQLNEEKLKLNNELNGKTLPKKAPIVRKRSFIKTPSFSEYLEQFQNGEFDPSQKPEIIFCGQQSLSRQLLIIIGLIIFFTCSAIGVYYLWATDTYEAAILKNLVLAYNSTAFAMWKNPTVKTLLKVHIFNYTNVDDFLNHNATRLKVEDVGPYIYEETLERVNVVFNGNSTITYQDYRHYTFRPDLSKKSHQHDKVIVPNIPLIGAIALSKQGYTVARWGLNGIINNLGSKMFLTLPAHRFLWGYEDELVSLARGILALKNDFAVDNFGLIALKNGTSKDRITIYTGENDLNKLGLIDNFNGETHTPFWSTEECNKVDGTDGAHFPLNAIHNLEPINVYNKELCRKIPLVYTESVMVNLDDEVEMPALRYRFPKHLFSSPDIVPENQCFCHLDAGVCPPEGLFNATPCLYGLPFFPSFPHFYLADPALNDLIEGMKPDPEKHLTYLDIHPNLAFPISGSSRMQLNVQVQPAKEIKAFSNFKDGSILPVAWLEVSLDQLPQDIIDILYHATFSAATMKTVLRFLTLVVAGITFSLLMTWLYANYTSKLYRRRLAEQIKCNYTTNSLISHRPTAPDS